MLESVTAARLLLAARMRVDHRLRVEQRYAAMRDNSPVHKAADRHLDAMTVAVMYGFMRGKKAYKHGGTDAAVKAIQAALLVSLPPVLQKARVDGGNAAFGMLARLKAAEARDLAGPIKIKMKLDASDPEAARWALEHAAELAKNLSETSEQAIKLAIARQADTGEDAYDEILDAIGDEARAELIARTETMFAANEGQREAWDQAVEEGLLPEDAMKVWIAAGDPCPECEELDGEEVKLDEEYPNDGGDGPPLHPNCRCTEGIA